MMVSTLSKSHLEINFSLLKLCLVVIESLGVLSEEVYDVLRDLRHLEIHILHILNAIGDQCLRLEFPSISGRNDLVLHD